jgi:uncharacterized membrane protein YvlD (DUF360 family)
MFDFVRFFDFAAIFSLTFLLMWAVPRKNQGVISDFIGSLLLCVISYTFLKAPILGIWGGWSFPMTSDLVIHFWSGVFSFIIVGSCWLFAAYCHRKNTSIWKILGIKKQNVCQTPENR